ncbi:peroxin Pex14/17-Penicillium chrysogenum [Penicillium soppii]|uniref:peroxin Pex14/17-Penicillium chrysogenum n=1 Tax=Penicillium soppii TaxID=69789 RepID=UPI002549ABA5|nr:peroxin Pex14/17-Penicillium chrysogenum [Penicillium soppii]KAJ5856092.1 peroxin Pex14/17-Penicillium chrysogenum [Penicillium soppii]
MAPSQVRGKVILLLNYTFFPRLSLFGLKSTKNFIMPEDNSKPASIPEWQRPNKTANESPSPSSDNAPATTTTPRQTLLDQASKFLEDESIRDASIDRKVSFLESKGLSSDDIQQVLGVSRNAEASSTPTEKPQEETQSNPSTQTEVTPSSPVTASPPTTTMPQQRPPPASRDVPPIITYPEFLFEQNKPPPLVTMQNLMYTLYGAAGLGAAIYGASEYIVKPMLASLTSARHELANTAEENLQKLNAKLEQTVSVVPPQLTARKATSNDDEEDDDSITSDPTELFHRDMATQTSPEPTPAPSTTDAVNSADVGITLTTKVNDHVSRVESITSQLRGIIDSEKDASTLDDSMRTGLTELHHYCDTLIYSAPAYSAGSTYGVWNSNNGSNDNSGLRKAEDEAIAGFRADIRGVKGALLSARNFPASRGGRLGSGLPVGRR